MGRHLQEQEGQSPQVVLTMPILEGLDGVQKMSKSLNNYIGITDAPDDMFGKIMSISDELMWRYFQLLSFRPLAEIEQFKADVANGKNPRDIKVLLAKEIIERFHSKEAAEKAEQDFVQRFQKNAIPDDIPEVEVEAGADGIAIANALKAADLVKSTSDAMRMIKQSAVKRDGEKVDDTKLICTTEHSGVYQVGKRRFAKIVFK
jgi:tyrosyl-tRNA synthetase